LHKARFLFLLLSRPWLVKTAQWFIGTMMKAGLPVGWLVKPTVYQYFVGGKSLNDCAPLVGRMCEFNVKSILDFSVEGLHDDSSISKTLEETLRSIVNASGNPNIPFAVFKPTAFASSSLLENIAPGEQPAGNLAVEYQKFKERVSILCQKAAELDVPLMIDAEDSWYQHLVDETVEQMMQKYNGSKAIVFNTLQMYRTDRLGFLKTSIAKAREGGYFYGVKFVRGAYMEKERKRAIEKGYPSPIQPTKEASDKAFDDALILSLENIDVVEILCGSHNENSNRLLAENMIQRGLSLNDRRIWFAQLFGMSDHISFNLAALGFNVAKYVPYGPVKSVLPYLFRRAEENTSIAGQTSRELNLIQAELRRRRHNGRS